jgi:hypothetical protein
LLDIVEYVPNFEMFASCEATGEQSNYIRDGMDYEVWINNAKRLLDQPKVNKFYAMMTINALCLSSIIDFMNDMLALREIYGKERSPILSLNLVYYPEFQSITTLPTYIIEHYNDKLKMWYKERKEDLHDYEDVHVARIIKHMDKAISNPHSEEVLKKRQNDFKSFYTQYDERRGKDFRATFDPIIVDWYDRIPLNPRESHLNPYSYDDGELWKKYFNHLENNNIFECIENKNVLGIGTADGMFWETYNLYNPSSIIGLDPDNRWKLMVGVGEKNIIRESYETYLPKTGYDVIICFGLIYKLHSPIHLLELIARCRPEYIILEDIYSTKTGIQLVAKDNHGDESLGGLITDEIDCGFSTKLSTASLISVMENMSYKLKYSWEFKENSGWAKANTKQFIFKIEKAHG